MTAEVFSSQEKPYCSDLSIQAGEPLTATATPTTIFLLLEYNGAWGEKALDESGLPQPVKSRLKTYAKANPTCKVLLIKTHPNKRRITPRFFIAQTTEEKAEIFAFSLSDYTQLLELDFDAVLAGAETFQANHWARPLYLVCTNGRRDRCCARHGIAVFNALWEQTGSDSEPVVWQCSHIGGHRFAANLIYLPDGLLYGRVRAEDVASIIEAHRNGQVYLPHLRGRMRFPPPLQAAEIALRRQLGERNADALRHIQSQQSDQGWFIAFMHTASRVIYDVRVAERPGETLVYDSCLLDKQTRVPVYEIQIIEKAV